MNTNYGLSLGLYIPKLVCNISGVVVNGVVYGVDCNKPNIFGKMEDNPADLVGANQLILLMINAFVDFFIQYYNIGETTNLEVALLFSVKYSQVAVPKQSAKTTVISESVII